MGVIIYHVKSTPQAPSERTDRKIPEGLESVILDCLKQDSADRPYSALELKQRLSACGDAGAWDQDQASEWWTRHMNEAPTPESQA